VSISILFAIPMLGFVFKAKCIFVSCIIKLSIMEFGCMLMRNVSTYTVYRRDVTECHVRVGGTSAASGPMFESQSGCELS
jgi:hypothetical protein